MQKTANQKRQLFAEIEQLLERISIPIRYENGDFQGGLCRFNEQIVFILNKRLSIEQKLQIAKWELRQLDFDEFYVRPQVREFLEEKD